MSEKIDLTSAVALANECLAWLAAKGETESGIPREADCARAIVAMAGVCDAVRLELGTLPSRHRRERLGDARLHRIFDALEAIDTPAPSGVAAIPGAAPELPEEDALEAPDRYHVPGRFAVCWTCPYGARCHDGSQPCERSLLFRTLAAEVDEEDAFAVLTEELTSKAGR